MGLTQRRIHDHRWSVITLAVAVALGVAPVAASAQDDGEVTFPFTTSGQWEGLLDFSGSLSSDYEGSDGFNVKVTDVIGGTRITLDLMVDGDGRVAGSMDVYLEWFDEIAGAASNGDPYHVLHDHLQTGVLGVSGQANELVAAGSLTHATNTVADGERVEEVSNTTTREVEWVFALTQAACDGVVGRLTRTSGISLVGSALLPPFLESDGTEYHNELVARLQMWPKGPASSDVIDAAVDEVTMLSDELRGREFPQASHLLGLIDAWNDLQAEVRALQACDGAFSAPALDRSWLVLIIQAALEQALESPGHYESSELIELWDVGQLERAFDGELVVAFLDVFHDKLDDAIANGDTKAIGDILDFATSNGYPALGEKAAAAL